jgi:hypothetical protein
MLRLECAKDKSLLVKQAQTMSYRKIAFPERNVFGLLFEAVR